MDDSKVKDGKYEYDYSDGNKSEPEPEPESAPSRPKEKPSKSSKNFMKAFSIVMILICIGLMSYGIETLIAPHLSNNGDGTDSAFYTVKLNVTDTRLTQPEQVFLNDFNWQLDTLNVTSILRIICNGNTTDIDRTTIIVSPKTYSEKTVIGIVNSKAPNATMYFDMVDYIANSYTGESCTLQLDSFTWIEINPWQNYATLYSRDVLINVVAVKG